MSLNGYSLWARNRSTFFTAVLATVCAIALTLPASAFAERSIGLSSLSFKFSAPIGGGGQGEVYVSNTGDEDIDVLVYAADQVVNEEGEVEYQVPNRDQIDFSNPAAWLSIQMPTNSKAIGNTPYVELKPGEQVPVAFAFKVPSDATSGDNNVVLFFEMAVLDSASGTVSTVSGRIGTRITIRVEGIVREAVDVEPFYVPFMVFDNTAPYSFTVRNGGNIDEIIDVDIQMLTSNDEIAIESRIATESTLYATEKRELSGEIVPPGTAFGRRTIRAIVTYVTQAPGQQTEERIVEERQVWMVPLWAAILAASLFAVLLLWIVWRLGIRSARKRAERPDTGRRRSSRRRSESSSAREPNEGDRDELDTLVRDLDEPDSDSNRSVERDYKR